MPFFVDGPSEIQKAHINPVIIASPNTGPSTDPVPDSPVPQFRAFGAHWSRVIHALEDGTQEEEMKESAQARSLRAVDFNYLRKFLRSGESRTYSLGQPINHTSAGFNVRQFIPDVNIYTLPQPYPLTVGEDAICYNPGISTQIDTLTHFGFNGTFWNGTVKATDIYRVDQSLGNAQRGFHDDVTLNGGHETGMPTLMGPLNESVPVRYLTDFGADSLPPFASRAIVLDALTYKRNQNPEYATNLTALGVNVTAWSGEHVMLKAGVCITEADVVAMLDEYGLEVVEGDSVVFYTGWQHVGNPAPAVFLAGEPGPDMSAARYLAARKVWSIGSDAFGCECLIPTNVPALMDMLPAELPRTLPAATLPDGNQFSTYPVHFEMLVTNGIFILENLDLARTAEDGVREGLFILGAPKSPTPQVGPRIVHPAQAFISAVPLVTRALLHAALPSASFPTPIHKLACLCLQ